jgi:LmbE family N-acetylglucosaminyl deacetylase
MTALSSTLTAENGQMPVLSRRNFLGGSIAFVPLLAAKKLKVVVTGGHPGDPEYGCGGTVAKYTDLGHEVTLLYLNRGEKGCPGETAKACGTKRVTEAQRACEILKAHARFADETDGEAIVDPAHYDAFRRLLESEQPDVVFTQWPIDNHRDHRATCTLVYDAWLRMGKRFALYYYEVSDGEDTLLFHPTDYVDISQTEGRKRAACYAHASQSPDKFYSLQSQVTRFRGIESGHAQAEAFIRHVGNSGNFLP